MKNHLCFLIPSLISTESTPNISKAFIARDVGSVIIAKSICSDSMFVLFSCFANSHAFSRTLFARFVKTISLSKQELSIFFDKYEKYLKMDSKIKDIKLKIKVIMMKIYKFNDFYSEYILSL